MRWLKKIIITLFALQIMFAPDVCLMLCCHAPEAVSHAASHETDESHLPPCHRKQAPKVTNATAVHIAVHAPCTHAHDAKPAAWQRTNDERSLSLLSVALVVAPMSWQTNGTARVIQLPYISFPIFNPPLLRLFENATCRSEFNSVSC